jgi:hypothetical protein
LQNSPDKPFNLSTGETFPLRRSLMTLLIVAALSAWINRAERAAGLPAEAGPWVRTSQGWQSRAAVEPQEVSSPPPVHPGVIAALQLGASLLFLVAFPARVAVQPVSLAPAPAGSHRRKAASATAAG